MQIIKAARGRITGHFGDTDVPGASVKSHAGMDIGHGEMSAADLLVVAPADGTIIAAGWYGTYGNRIEIDHGAGWSSLLAHLARIDRWTGRVSLRTPLAEMGGTGGRWPVHLHQELRFQGTPVDPEKYLRATTAGLTTTTLQLKEGSTMLALAVTKPNGTKDLYTIGQEFLKYEANFDNATVTRNLLAPDDSWHEISEAQLPGVLASFDVPAKVPHILRDGRSGHVWSRAREIADTLARLEDTIGRPPV